MRDRAGHQFQAVIQLELKGELSRRIGLRCGAESRDIYCRWWVVLLKRHSSIVRRPGRTCKPVRSPNSLPAISEEVKGSHAIAHARVKPPFKNGAALNQLRPMNTEKFTHQNFVPESDAAGGGDKPLRACSKVDLSSVVDSVGFGRVFSMNDLGPSPHSRRMCGWCTAAVMTWNR